jgi:hypothetical protein
MLLQWCQNRLLVWHYHQQTLGLAHPAAAKSSTLSGGAAAWAAPQRQEAVLAAVHQVALCSRPGQHLAA